MVNLNNQRDSCLLEDAIGSATVYFLDEGQVPTTYELLIAAIEPSALYYL